MKLKVISPQEMLFEGDVDSVTLPGVMGSFTVLKNHASLIACLTAGNLHYRTSGDNANENQEAEKVSIPGGLVSVYKNEVTVCLNEVK